jgi:hypothetical protein
MNRVSHPQIPGAKKTQYGFDDSFFRRVHSTNRNDKTFEDRNPVVAQWSLIAEGPVIPSLLHLL